MTRINLPGGYIEIISGWRDHRGRNGRLYRAISDHTHEIMECFSEAKARFHIRYIHEQFTCMMIET